MVLGPEIQLGGEHYVPPPVREDVPLGLGRLERVLRDAVVLHQVGDACDVCLPGSPERHLAYHHVVVAGGQCHEVGRCDADLPVDAVPVLRPWTLSPGRVEENAPPGIEEHLGDEVAGAGLPLDAGDLDPEPGVVYETLNILAECDDLPGIGVADEPHGAVLGHDRHVVAASRDHVGDPDVVSGELILLLAGADAVHVHARHVVPLRLVPPGEEVASVYHVENENAHGITRTS